MLKKQATRSFWPKRKFFNSTTATKSLSSTRSYCGSPSDTSWFHAHQTLLEKNKKWVAEQRAIDPEFFTKLAKGQTPQFLWIGCSDSRVPANVITDMPPGSVFVHRNVANLAVHSDMNLLSVLQYAVDVLAVKHIIICGHYGCGGVLAAMTNRQFGIVDNWLRHIKDVYQLHQQELDAITDHTERANRMVELNVMEQLYSVSRTSIVKNAWERRRLAPDASPYTPVFPLLHGWVYDINDGYLRHIKTIKNEDDIPLIVKDPIVL